MSPTLACARVLEAVIARQVALDTAIEEAEQGSKQPKLRQCAYGSCRHYVHYDALLGDLLQRPIRNRERRLHFILVAGMYQLEHMTTPDHAVVNEAVGLMKARYPWATKLANGVLREFIRRRDGDGLPTHEHGFPADMVAMVRADWPHHWGAILAASDEHPTLTLRVNRRRTTRDAYCERLKSEGLAHTLTKDSNLGITLDTPLNVEQIPGFDEGMVSVQDESAQLAIAVLDLQPGQRVLDGCAAPGGKTGLILESTPRLEVVAVDRPHRMAMVQDNLDRLGLTATLLSGDLMEVAENWQGERFDRVLLDVPCSGTGVMRRHPDIRFHRDAEAIRRFAALQVGLLTAGWSLLKPGGRLVYVTCSVLTAENEGVIRQFTDSCDDFNGDFDDNFALQCANQIPGINTGCGIQRLPGVHWGDGFYYAILLKPLPLEQ